jgi:alpha-1,2-mannosyltransferase
MPPATGTAGTRAVPARPPAAAWPLRPGVVIAIAAVLGLGLRAFALARPGYLTGFTQYDDGVYIGNSLRLVSGVIPYRDFAMVQPPGVMLLMVPAALLGKALGSMWALSAARLLTVGADTANIVLLGLLARHRGPLAAGVASGGYAVYPAALNASQSLFLEPWLNLFCLLGALVLFDGDRLAGQAGGPGARVRGWQWPLWAGVCFGFASAVKIWAAVPALIAFAVCLRARRGRLPFAGGFAAGIAVPCLPFLVLAPGGFGRTVFVSELVQATHGRVGPASRVADITGITVLGSVRITPHLRIGLLIAALIVVFLAAAWIRARRAGARAAPLDWYAWFGLAAVTVMLFTPSEWYEHYAAFAGPFLMLPLGLSAAWLLAPGPGRSRAPAPWFRAAAVAAALAIAAVAAIDGYSVTKLYPGTNLARASALIPPGACVLTDTVSATIVIDRFTSGTPGCPALVDAVGTLIATTDGQDLYGPPSVSARDTEAWQAAFEHAQYVWLYGNRGYTGARIIWTSSLHAYFVHHFRLIGLRSSFRGSKLVPGGGLYVRT